MIRLKRSMVLLGCTAVFAAAPLVAAFPAAASECPAGTVPSSFSGVCTQGSGGGGVAVPQVPPPSANVFSNPNGLSSVDGVPCTPQKIGKCIALQESQG